MTDGPTSTIKAYMIIKVHGAANNCCGQSGHISFFMAIQGAATVASCTSATL